MISQDSLASFGEAKRTKHLWGKLKGFLLNKNTFTVSGQVYLNLLQSTRSDDGQFIDYSFEGEVSVRIQSPKTTLSLDEAKQNNSEKVDSTGVIALWPAEELLAYFCVKNLHVFDDCMRIAEYGAGYSGLAGIVLAKMLAKQRSGEESQIVMEISDGNAECASKLKENIALNTTERERLGDAGRRITSLQKIWGVQQTSPESTQMEKFDAIIIADCLFFRDFHYALISQLQNDLKPTGFCIIIAPSRGGTASEFLLKCKDQLNVEELKFNDQAFKSTASEARNRVDYIEDMHEYFFYKLTHSL